MKPTPAPLELAPRLVSCPTCAGPSVYSTANVFRPFCSERCKQIDLGAWASEQFAVPEPALPDDQQPLN